MSRFRPAGFRNRRTAWRRASRPVSARRRSTAFRDGWNRIAAAGPHGTPLRLGTRSRHGRRAPRGRRFTLGGSGKSVARCLARQRSRFTHYYFYIRDEVLGPIVMRVGSFFPFQTSYYLNGHSFIEQELKRD